MYGRVVTAFWSAVSGSGNPAHREMALGQLELRGSLGGVTQCGGTCLGSAWGHTSFAVLGRNQDRLGLLVLPSGSSLQDELVLSVPGLL